MTAGAPIAFATEELYPFGPGGIGRLVHHLVAQALADGRAVHLFVPSTLGVSQADVERLWGKRVSVSVFAAAAADALARSQSLAAHVVDFCNEHEPFEWIEFPDFRGLAFATLHTAAARGLRGAPRLHLRVHGPNSLVSWHEGLPFDATRAAEFDLERSSLAIADTVIAPMASVRDAVATFFRFDDAWRSRVCLCLPPRSGDAATPPTSAGGGAGNRRIVFPTKVQGVKRPDLFVQGVLRLLERQPGWTGQAIFAAHRNAALERELWQGVPRTLRERFEWVRWSDEERARNFAGQIIVIPSDFETLSLAAWEAASVGALVVASTRCPAFAPGSPWTAWPGFHGFDGTADGLAEALGLALDSPSPGPLVVPASPLLRVESKLGEGRATPVTASDIEPIVGGTGDWSRRITAVSRPWVLLLSHESEADVPTLREAAGMALSRRPGAQVVYVSGPGLETPMQAWGSRRLPTGPLVVRTELAASVLSPSQGRRAVLARAIQLDLECIALFVPIRSSSRDEERFPPLFLDAHPMALRAPKRSLRDHLLDAARHRFKEALSARLGRPRRS